MRLDKFLAHTTGNSRSDVKRFLRQKAVQVAGEVVTSGSFHVDVNQQIVTIFGDVINYEQYVYLLLNKPAGYLSATKDGQTKTVMALIDAVDRRFDLAIAGRLDKDTEGLLILTNDGQFLHDVITPKKQVYKKYLAKIEGELTAAKIATLERGVVIKDGKDLDFKTAPARVKLVLPTLVEIEICEGKFHQVRRMLAHVGCFVVHLQRVAIGELTLDNDLKLGEYRKLKEAELDAVKKNPQSE